MQVNFNLHPKQALVFNSPANEILYGGAVGGGKSYLMRALAVTAAAGIPGLNVRIFRRKYSELIANHMAGPNGLRALLAPWEKAKFVRFNKTEIVFLHKNGPESKITLTHLNHKKDAYDLQGDEIHLALLDEAGTIWWEAIEYIRTRMRAVGLKVPAHLKNLVGKMVLSANPGGICHQELKEQFIEPVEPLTLQQMPKAKGGMLRQFVPAFLEDNPTLMREDPGYEDRVLAMGKLGKALRFGDWNSVDGAYFDNWDSDIHVVKRIPLPDHLARIRSFDFGSYHPFSHGWYAVADERTPLERKNGTIFYPPPGTLIKYKEWYGKSGVNKGVKMLPEHIAAGILVRQDPNERFTDSVADAAFFNKGTGRSVADIFEGMGLRYRMAQNDRFQGWQQLKQRLGNDTLEPTIYFTEACPDTIRCLPIMQHCETRPEDIDSDLEDHAVDETRYACMTRALTTKLVAPRPTGNLLSDLDPRLAELGIEG